MRQLLITTLMFFFAGIFVAGPAQAAKIKQQQTLYADAEGVALLHPEGVACDDKTLAVADTGNSRVVLYRLEGETMVPKTVLPMEGMSPIIIRMNSRGELYVLDSKERSVDKLGADGKVAEKLKPANLPAPQTFVPRSFCFDRNDNIYLADIFGERVLVLDSAGKFQKQIPFPEGYREMSDITIGPQGDIYLLDGIVGSIYKADAGADSFQVLSQGLKEFMNFPVSLALDNEGTIYLVDQYGSGLALVGKDGSFIGRKFGLGWEDGQLYYPAQICINNQGRLFVADRNNNRVQMFLILNE